MKHNIGQKLALYPTPATVVGTVGEGGKVNWLLVAHVGIVSHSKLLLSVHSAHYSVKAIDAVKRFSVNIIDESFLAAADYTGTVSGAKVDKSGLFDYHLGEAGMPIIEQSPLAMECEVIDTYEIDGFKNYICAILGTYVEEDKLDEQGRPDYAKLKPVLFEMPTYKYLRTGDVVGDCMKLGKAFGENK
ncbi:MAG: flavin reductase family protein [Bacteroidales bacterium]|nr:flavin reductase family protein [Bacteroidales bacterium]